MQLIIIDIQKHYINNLLSFLFIYLFIWIGDPVTINAIANASSKDNEIYTSIIDDFNEYSKNKNLDITINLDLKTLKDNDYVNTLKSDLSEKSTKYDLIFYPSGYTSILADHFLDLTVYIPREHIKLYDSEKTSKLCEIEDMTVCLVCICIYT